MMSKPVSFTCQHFPDYSLLSSIFLLFCLFAQEEEGSCKFSSFFCPFSDQLFLSGRWGFLSIVLFFWSSFLPREERVPLNFSLVFFWSTFLGDERVLVNFSLFFSFSFFFLIKFFCPGRSGFLLRSQAREQLERDGTLPSQWNRSPSNQCKWNWSPPLKWNFKWKSGGTAAQVVLGGAGNNSGKLSKEIFLNYFWQFLWRRQLFLPTQKDYSNDHDQVNHNQHSASS